ncbi:hypothetical protein N2152v2_008684 [Parachlorella kessleri]
MSDISFFANLDDTQATPLHWAAVQGNLDEVQSLLAAEPGSVAVSDGHGWTALHWAAGAGQAECVAALVRAGASLEARGSELHTPWVAKLGDIMPFDGPATQAEVDNLAATGFVEEAHRLREAIAQPDPKATAGATPLHVAAGMGAVGCLCRLLQLGAQLEAANSLGLTALHLAAACNHVSALQALVQAGADFQACDSKNTTPLHVAAGLDSLECLQELIRLGAVIDARGAQRMTPLHLAASEGATACVKELLAAGADIEAAATCGVRPLDAAAMAGMPEVVRILIDAGANVHATDEHGHTPLHHAAASGCVDAALALVSAGADVEAATTQPFESKTPIQLAAGLGNMAMVSALAEAGADINRRSGYGLTCLHLFLGWAGMGRVPEAPKRLQQLLDLGASVELASATWPTPVDEMLLLIDNPKNCKLPTCVPELIRAMAAAGCSVSTTRHTQEGELQVNSIISWFNRLGSSFDWPPSLSSSAVDGAWGEKHQRLVQHFCDMAEALLAIGCPPVKLCVSGSDRAALPGAEPTSRPRTTWPVDLPQWAAPHLREVVPLAASGLRWSLRTHRAFPASSAQQPEHCCWQIIVG